MLTVTVTQEHISKGRRCKPQECALALALSEALGSKAAVGNVYFRRSYVHMAELPLPENAIAFRKAFDSKQPVEPFSFEIPDPRE